MKSIERMTKMRKVLTFVCLLAVCQYVAAQCGSTQTYKETLRPECAQQDLKLKWPNYENQATYYRCNGIRKPVLVPCDDGEYFAFVYQQCVTCANYIPPVQCSQLKTQNPPKCVPIKGAGSGTSYPTPNYPNTTASTTKMTTTKSTTSKATTTITATGGETSQGSTTGITPPVVTTTTTEGTTEVPPPPSPSPVSNNPKVPMPPTPEPTPPSVQEYPPSIISPPVST